MPSRRSCELCNRKKAKCDRSLPQCTRCLRFGNDCVYPTSRKRPAFEKQYRTFRSRLLDENNADQIDDLLDELDIELLQHAISRRQPSFLSSASQPASSGTPDHLLSTPLVQMMMPATDTTVDSYNTRQDNGFQLANNPQDIIDVAGPPGVLEDGYAFPDIPWWDIPLGNPWEDPIMGMDATSGFSFANAHSSENGPYCLPIPRSIVDELIDLFFDKVAGFTHLIHPARFRAKFHSQENPTIAGYQLSVIETLLVYSMMALSARFCDSPEFLTIPAHQRGSLFAAHANRLYQEATRLDALEAPCSLTLLQGCILLAIYQVTCRPSTKSWVIIGTACRLALELELNRVDADILSGDCQVHLAHEEWSRREEQRRAWWLIWELDIFSSTVLRRPYSLDRSQIWVLLPVSDSNWQQDRPIASKPIITDPLRAWESLKGSENQDERAWFLVCSSLMATAHDMSQRPTTGEDERREFAATLDCFSLLLPDTFDLRRLRFDEKNYAGANWVISIYFMLQTIRLLLRQGSRSRDRSANGSRQMSPVSAFEDSASEDDLQCMQRLFRVVRFWNPEFIGFACPFIVCTLIGPGCYNIYLCHKLGAVSEDGNSRPRGRIWLDMYKLVLKRIAAYWSIGAHALELIEAFEAEKWSLTSMKATPEYNTLARDFRVLLPGERPVRQ